jgi:hypothetical protein
MIKKKKAKYKTKNVLLLSKIIKEKDTDTEKKDVKKDGND